MGDHQLETGPPALQCYPHPKPMPSPKSLLALLLPTLALAAQSPASKPSLDQLLLETDIPHLQHLYATHQLTVTEVVQWHLARIARYNGIYRAIETSNATASLALAAREDAEAAAAGSKFHPPPMWGIPIVIKANTSVAGLVTTDGWQGYTLPGHELLAPRDATIVAKLKAAGAILLGKTNMPDFAASDTNRSSSFGRTGNAYDVRFSPGGSSGGTVTAVTANFAVLGNGTDTGNSIRMPAATSAVVGLFPTRGLVSIAGIAPLDWLLDNTGPIARDTTDVAIALSVMAGPDPLDPVTVTPAAEAGRRLEPGPYTQYLKPGSLQGKRFGVPAFILHGAGVPFQGVDSTISPADALKREAAEAEPLRPETHAAFLRSLDGLRTAGATVVFADDLLPDSFAQTASRVGTLPYIREGTDTFLSKFGPAQYHSADDYQRATGSPLPPTVIGGPESSDRKSGAITQAIFETDPQAAVNVLEPRRRTLELYLSTLDRLHLDGYVYPATQLPPPDETLPQPGGASNQITGGPHSDTSWVNIIGVPAIVVSGGFYPSGLPFGLEISTRPWHDGDLLGYAYAYEQATHHRHPPVLVEQGLLPNAP